MRIKVLSVDRNPAPDDTVTMKEGPDISRLAALIGDPARANILAALMNGKALTAGELADEAGVTPATASSHLAQLADAGLIRPRAQGRHRYFELCDADVAQMLEQLSYLAAAKGQLRTRTGPRDADLREARICYDHLAGARAVQLFDSMASRAFFDLGPDSVALSPAGETFVKDLGIDLASLQARRRPLCRVCLDWSERRSHLSGALGAALLARFVDLNWLDRQPGTRRAQFTKRGGAAFEDAFPM
ncbi:MAG: winged helix-turn-helix domain-containing protein [Pseudomonadota bacterium]